MYQSFSTRAWWNPRVPLEIARGSLSLWLTYFPFDGSGMVSAPTPLGGQLHDTNFLAVCKGGGILSSTVHGAFYPATAYELVLSMFPNI